MYIYNNIFHDFYFDIGKGKLQNYNYKLNSKFNESGKKQVLR